MAILKAYDTKQWGKRDEFLLQCILPHTLPHVEFLSSSILPGLAVQTFSRHKNPQKGGVVQWHFAKEQTDLLRNGEGCQAEELKGKIRKALKCLILSRDALLSKPCKLMALPVQGTQRR